MRIAEIPTWEQYWLTLKDLLIQVATWLLTSGYGKPILVVSLILVVLYAINGIHGNVKADDSFNIRDDYWR